MPDKKEIIYESCFIKKPAYPVARFHFGNGATLAKTNWFSDTSENEMQQSVGIMVNYIYDKLTLAHNHARYEQDGDIICTTNARQLLPV